MPAKPYIAPQWQYDYSEPKGKRMRLLSKDEAKLAAGLLQRHVKYHSTIANSERYKSEFSLHASYAEKIWLSACRYLRKIDELPSDVITDIDMDALNQEMQLIFSDAGWRWVRKEISQLKKRVTKGRLEVSADLIDKLKSIMEREGLASVDEVLDHLICLDLDSQSHH